MLPRASFHGVNLGRRSEERRSRFSHFLQAGAFDQPTVQTKNNVPIIVNKQHKNPNLKTQFRADTHLHLLTTTSAFLPPTVELTCDTPGMCLPHLVISSDLQQAHRSFQPNTAGTARRRSPSPAQKINEERQPLNTKHRTQKVTVSASVQVSMEIPLVCTRYIYNVDKIIPKYASYTRQRKPCTISSYTRKWSR